METMVDVIEHFQELRMESCYAVIISDAGILNHKGLTVYMNA